MKEVRRRWDFTLGCGMGPWAGCLYMVYLRLWNPYIYSELYILFLKCAFIQNFYLLYNPLHWKLVLNLFPAGTYRYARSHLRATRIANMPLQLLYCDTVSGWLLEQFIDWIRLPAQDTARTGEGGGGGGKKGSMSVQADDIKKYIYIFVTKSVVKPS